jgi:hypothetical protein
MSLLDCLDSIANLLPDYSQSQGLFEIYESCFDKAEKSTLLSGKIIYGKLSIGDEYTLQPLGEKVKIAQLYNCQGERSNEITYNNFITVRIINYRLKLSVRFQTIF